MRLLFRTLAWLFRALLRTRNDLARENMALRQQLSVYGQLKVKPRLKTEDRVFWVLFSMGYRSWRTCLRFVQPRTVLRWHAAGFKIFWRKKCGKTGRPRIPTQHQDLIRQMLDEIKKTILTPVAKVIEDTSDTNKKFGWTGIIVGGLGIAFSVVLPYTPLNERTPVVYHFNP